MSKKPKPKKQPPEEDNSVNPKQVPINAAAMDELPGPNDPFPPQNWNWRSK